MKRFRFTTAVKREMGIKEERCLILNFENSRKLLFKLLGIKRENISLPALQKLVKLLKYCGSFNLCGF